MHLQIRCDVGRGDAPGRSRDLRGSELGPQPPARVHLYRRCPLAPPIRCWLLVVGGGRHRRHRCRCCVDVAAAAAVVIVVAVVVKCGDCVLLPLLLSLSPPPALPRGASSSSSSLSHGHPCPCSPRPRPRTPRPGPQSPMPRLPRHPRLSATNVAYQVPPEVSSDCSADVGAPGAAYLTDGDTLPLSCTLPGAPASGFWQSCSGGALQSATVTFPQGLRYVRHATVWARCTSAADALSGAVAHVLTIADNWVPCAGTAPDVGQTGSYVFHCGVVGRKLRVSRAGVLAMSELQVVGEAGAVCVRMGRAVNGSFWIG